MSVFIGRFPELEQPVSASAGVGSGGLTGFGEAADIYVHATALIG